MYNNLPYYNYDRLISQNYFDGSINFNSNGNNYLSDTNKLETNMTNNFTYNSLDYISNFGLKNSYNIPGDEYEYMNATEHVNSIFNLKSIIKFNFKNSIEEHFYPLKIKLIDLNLFYNVHIYKK